MSAGSQRRGRHHDDAIVAECACGATYTAQQWAELELVGVVDGLFELRAT